jgi:hypothetical protein
LERSSLRSRAGKTGMGDISLLIASNPSPCPKTSTTDSGSESEVSSTELNVKKKKKIVTTIGATRLNQYLFWNASGDHRLSSGTKYMFINLLSKTPFQYNLAMSHGPHDTYRLISSLD